MPAGGDHERRRDATTTFSLTTRRSHKSHNEEERAPVTIVAGARSLRAELSERRPGEEPSESTHSGSSGVTTVTDGIEG